jgi:arsenite methyltransferase
MSTTDFPVDVGVLREEIRETYTEVSTEQQQEFVFPTGRAWAQELGYPEPALSRVPDASVESFAGVDMTAAMLERTRASAEQMGLANVEVHESLIESLPLEGASVDVVISNGVIDLVPDKDAVFDEIDRVLRPGGRLQFADVVIHHEVSEDARKRIDLWTG